MSEQLHKVQVSILSALRHTEDARFSTLMRPTGLQSDTFKFHLRKLSKLGYIEKSKDGPYRLTSAGKEFANNLDESRRTPQRQPKLSILLVVREPVIVPMAVGPKGQNDSTTVSESAKNSHLPQKYLFQQRRRSPYFGFWSCIGGPVQWGEDAEQTARRELQKQTGLQAACRVRSFYRKRDYDAASRELLEDKLFIVLEATDVTGELTNTWHGGTNQWMTLEELETQPYYFSSVREAIEALQTDRAYTSKETYYQLDEY